MASRVDIEEIETTKSEQLLAVILAIFFLIGCVWAYQEIDDWVAAAVGIDNVGFPEDASRESRREVLSFVFRFVFVALLLGLGYWLLARLRRANSRYLLVAFSLLGAASLLAFVLAADYITDYVDPVDLGPLVLSLFGIAATLAAFAVLQRYLARRVPFRRVRKHECPFCGYPVATTPRCEGCGREVIASCATCGENRRVGTLHCGACGHA